jgi:predicted glycosyltransferase
VKVWIDLANSPHVPLFEPIVAALRDRDDDVVVTVRDHAQTLPLAKRAFPEATVVGGASPAGRLGKARTIAGRAAALRSFARKARPDVALSHGSYAQVVAARAFGVPALTMMDYEHQPANHLSFRLARRVIVPETFPDDALRRFGARRKTVRYAGFKEELYLADTRPDPGMLAALGLDPLCITAAMRPPPEGALYHRGGNTRFDDVLEHVLADGAQVVLLPRTAEQATRYHRAGVVVPDTPPNGATLLATVDFTVGAGGTMTRESALLGTPTYTVYMAELAAVDAELIRQGRIVDLREAGTPLVTRRDIEHEAVGTAGAARILAVVLSLLDEVARNR